MRHVRYDLLRTANSGTVIGPVTETEHWHQSSYMATHAGTRPLVSPTYRMILHVDLHEVRTTKSRFELLKKMAKVPKSA